jgi:molybdopterin-guanine dinucleotide biosynthesis protein A
MQRHAAPPHHLVVVAGGSGQRLGGIDKALCVIGGVRLVDWALATPVPGRRVVVRPAGRSPVGRSPDGRQVEVVSERPADGGPAAGLAAGAGRLIDPFAGEIDLCLGTDLHPADANDLVAVLAADHLGPNADMILQVTAALRRHPKRGVAVAAPDGDPQWLTAVWRAWALADALIALGDPRDAAVRRLVQLADPLMVDVPRVPSLDGPEDLVKALGDVVHLGLSGTEQDRTQVASAIGGGMGWTSRETHNPVGAPASLLSAPGHVDPAGGGPRAWLEIGPPEQPMPGWADARLVPVEGSG